MSGTPQHRVIATAGHVDHGKSSLVRALTGVDPDRLREEQERQMTIDLGFGYLPLPSGLTVGVVDVPGHRDFIHNMLAGLGGIDAVLLVVAADEGLMPQTREHIAILDLQGIRAGLIVLTKVDLVEDEEWLMLVEEDVRQGVAGTTLEALPLVRFSAVSREGLLELTTALDELLSTVPPAPDLGRPRLPIDRVFSLRGHGTVVTGTLTGGPLSVGDQVTVVPSGVRARVRSLQTHGQDVPMAAPGTRAAANLVGVQRDEVQRGEALTVGDWLHGSAAFDVRLRLLASATRPLYHVEEVHLFAATYDGVVRVRLLEGDALEPGQTQWAQIISSQPVPITHGDRFIIRMLSPSTTIGGGIVVDAHPNRRRRRRDHDALNWLEALQSASPLEVVALRLERSGPQSVRALAMQLDITDAQAAELVAEGQTTGTVIVLTEAGSAESTVVTDVGGWTELGKRAKGVVEQYHARHPLRPGMPREELRRHLRLRQLAYAAALERWQADGVLASESDRVRLPEWRAQVSGQDRQLADGWLAQLRQEAANGITGAELVGAGQDDLLAALVAEGQIRRLPDDVLMEGGVYAQALATVVGLLRSQPGVTVAQVRDALHSNRRATLALLAELDSQGITRREGDMRVAGRRFPDA